MNSISYINFINSINQCKLNTDSRSIVSDILDISTLSYANYTVDTFEDIEKKISLWQPLLSTDLFNGLYNSYYIFFKEFCLNQRIIEHLNNLLDNPTKYITNSDSYSVKLYIEGYVEGLGSAYFKNLIHMINNWYKIQIDNDLSSYWADYVRTLDYDDIQKSYLIIQIPKTFFINNPSWFMS